MFIWEGFFLLLEKQEEFGVRGSIRSKTWL
jgi:hypothetical protein